MGNLSLGITISATVHAAAVAAWLATTGPTLEPDDPREDEEPTVTPIEIVPASRETTRGTPPAAASSEVARGRSPAAAPPTASRTARDIAMTHDTSAVDPSGGAAAVELGTPPDPRRGGGPRSPYLDMRRGARPDVPRPAPRHDLDRVPAGTAPVAGERATGKLAPDGRGRKSDQGSFVAKVDADGDVTIEDRRDFSIRWAVPTPKQIGRGIAEWYESDKGPDGKRGKRTLENEVSGGIDQATVGCEGVRDAACAPDRTKTIIIPVFRGGFNPTDWLMRRTAGDPYASRKRAYLDETREERAQIGARHRAEQLERTAMIVRENLERAWASTTDAAARKRMLFELWDEIVEPSDEDSALARASRAARAQVIGFIRARLPQRGADAYRPEELAALNARRKSSATFSPYD